LSTIYEAAEAERNAYYEPSLVVIGSLTTKYAEATTVLPGHDTDMFTSPFVNQDNYEVARLLRKMAQDTQTDVNTDFFIILDSRTMSTSSAVLVEVKDPEEEGDDVVVETVRVDLKIVHGLVMSMSIGKPSMDELQDIAKRTSDGVVRWK